MNTILVHEDFLQRYTNFRSEWRLDVWPKLDAIFADMLNRQRNFPCKGRKVAIGKPVVKMPLSLIKEWFHGYSSQKKFLHGVTDFGLILKDRSWISSSVSKNIGIPATCDSWHVIEGGGDLVSFEYDESKLPKKLYYIDKDAESELAPETQKLVDAAIILLRDLGPYVDAISHLEYSDKVTTLEMDLGLDSDTDRVFSFKDESGEIVLLPSFEDKAFWNEVSRQLTRKHCPKFLKRWLHDRLGHGRN